MNNSQADRMTGRQTLAYGSETIDFSLSFSRRSRLSITVEPEGNVLVRAPVDAALESVLEQLRKKAGWILRQRDRFAGYGPVMPPKQYASGETHRYLGRQYRLRISSGELPSVRLAGRFFEIVTLDKTDHTSIKRQLEAWYRARAEKVFDDHLQCCLQSTYLRKLCVPQWSIRSMKRRWGSCTKSGTILLNLRLIEASPRCIDYVITHELCHLVHHNHNAEFYRLLGRVMPDWQAWKKKLELTSP
jgi:predicted metal-dependent hydrolase